MLKRWQAAGVLDGATASRIRAWEAGQNRPSRRPSSAEAAVRDQGRQAVVVPVAWQGAVALIG